MNEPTAKRKGPLLWLAGRSRRFWIVVALVPVLYVLSSGPMVMVAWRGQMIVDHALPFSTVMSQMETDSPEDASSVVSSVAPMMAMEVDIPEWWQQLYAPLWWMAEQPWGERLVMGYWNSFPIPERTPPGGSP